MAKADRFIKSMSELNPVERKWIFGNDTDDPLRFAFDAKRVVHPGVKGAMLPKEKWAGLWDMLINQTGKKTKRAAYIHIPFCQTRCLYCGFFQNFSDNDMEDVYIDHLIKELQMTEGSRFIKSHPFHAVYIGGGTPSVLSVRNIERLLNVINQSLPLSNDCEFTFESRFHDFDDEKINACLKGGVNRFSLGVQSFNSKVRTSIGRLDSGEFILERLKYLMSLDDAAIVIDLMYGLPHQSMEVWQDDVETLADCGIDGGDLYQLNVYEDSKLKMAVEKGTLPPFAKTSEQALMFKKGIEIMERKRFRRLSICHWARNTRERNIYNSLSKSGAVTIPFGSGAGGKADGYAFFVDRDIKSYIERIDKAEKPLMVMIVQHEDYGLHSSIVGQMDSGTVNLLKLKTDYGVDLKDIMEPVFNEWKRKGLIEINGDYLDLTIAGQFWYVNLTQAILDWLVMMKDENYTPVIKTIAGQG
jgi:oxygen-independent coproporphyrinogen-3 oxidase